MGQSQEDLFAVFATATGVTGNAARVSTQYLGVLNALLKPTSDLAALIKRQGFASGEAMLRSVGLINTLQRIGEESKKSGKPITDFIAQIEAVPLALALAGPQADVFREKLRQMGEAAGATDAAFREQAEGVNAAGFAWKQTRQEIEVALQQLGQELLPVATSFLGLLRPLVAGLQGVASGLGALPGPARAVAVGLLGIVAAAGPALFITGQLITAWGTLVSNAPGVASAIRSQITPLGLYGGAIAGVLLLLNDLITKQKEATQREIDQMVSDTNRVGQAIADMRAALAKGEVSAGSLEKARALAKALGDEIGRVGREINAGNAALKGLDADQWYFQAEAVKALEKKFSDLGKDRSNLEAFIRLAEGLPVTLEEIKKSAVDAAGPPGGISTMPDALKESVASMEAQIAESGALLSALRDSQEAYEILNTLLGLGVPLADALTGAYDAQAKKLIELKAAINQILDVRAAEAESAKSLGETERQIASDLQDLIDARQGASESVIFEPPAGVTDIYLEILGAAQKIRGEEEHRASALAEIQRQLQAGLITQQEAASLAEKYGKALSGTAVEFEAVMKRAWENIQDIAGSAIEEILLTGKVDFKELGQSILKIFAQMLAKLLVMWTANALKRIALERSVACGERNGQRRRLICRRAGGKRRIRLWCQRCRRIGGRWGGWWLIVERGVACRRRRWRPGDRSRHGGGDVLPPQQRREGSCKPICHGA